jgi:HSP20 family protein
MLTPFREMLTLREAMNRMFDESLYRPLWSNGGYGLDLDVEAKDDEFVIHANVPGLKPEDIHIDMMDNTVTFRGETKSETKKEDKHYLLMERHYGQFSRTVTLPASVNAAKAEATIENGVLTLRLPKSEEAKPKSITVKPKIK